MTGQPHHAERSTTRDRHRKQQLIRKTPAHRHATAQVPAGARLTTGKAIRRNYNKPIITVYLLLSELPDGISGVVV